MFINNKRYVMRLERSQADQIYVITAWLIRDVTHYHFIALLGTYMGDGHMSMRQ